MANKWDAVKMAPADPILGVAIAFNKDPLPADKKVCFPPPERGFFLVTVSHFGGYFDIEVLLDLIAHRDKIGTFICLRCCQCLYTLPCV